MKKVISKIVALVLSLTVVLGICASCDWVTVNTDRDANQIVATIKLNDKVEADNIFKKELNAGFLSYGYQYVQQYGYTTAQAYQTVLENLVSNRIVLQQARVELANTYNELLTKDGETEFEKYFKENALADGKEIDPAKNTIDNLKNYLTEYEYQKIMYDVRVNINDLIKSYEDDEEEETPDKETVAESNRTSPEVETPEDKSEQDKKDRKPTDDEYDIAKVVLSDEATASTNVYDLDMAVFKKYTIDISTNAKKKAFSELLSFLKDGGLILSTESQDLSDSENILQYSYFQDMIKQLMENQIVAKYEESLRAEYEDKLKDEGLWEEYVKEYKNQEALYKNDISAYESALSGVSDSSFVLYNPFEGYGYVLNLLIPFSTEQTATITAKKAEKDVTNADILALRQNLANSIVAKDQRDSWVYSSHGKYDKENKTFAFDKDYRTSTIENISNFVGEVMVRRGLEDGITEKDENQVEQTTWYFENVVATEIPMADFFASYVTPATGIENKYFVKDDATTVGKVEYSDELFDKFNDLMYAFSTDAGCLGSYYGYLISPYTNTYVPEFADAAKELISQGPGAYTTVLTDYGYHIMLCTKLVENVYDTSDSGKTAFMADLEVKDTLAYNYRQNKLDSIVSTEISKVASKLINDYKDDEDKVTYFQNTYKDLIPSDTEEK